MGKKHPILIEMAGVSSAAGALTLKSEPLKPGDLLCVQLVSVSNAITDHCLAKIGLERAGLQVWLETLHLVDAGRIYNYYKPVWVTSEHQLVVVFSEAGDGKACSVWGYGYLEELTK